MSKKVLQLRLFDQNYERDYIRGKLKALTKRKVLPDADISLLYDLKRKRFKRTVFLHGSMVIATDALYDMLASRFHCQDGNALKALFMDQAIISSDIAYYLKLLKLAEAKKVG